MTDNTNNEFPATLTAHWATGPVNVCKEHAKQLVALGSCMGYNVVITELKEDAQCSNCISENPQD